MLNLLPQNNKKEIRKEYKIRRFILVSSFGILVFIIGIISLLPTYLLARGKFEDLSTKDNALNSQLDLQKNQETNFTEQQKQMLGVLDKNTTTFKAPTSIITPAISAKGSNITLTDFLLTDTDETNNLMIHGKAATREDLITYQQALEKDKTWSSVDLPIGNLGPAKNNAFTITLNIAK